MTNNQDPRQELRDAVTEEIAWGRQLGKTADEVGDAVTALFDRYADQRVAEALAQRDAKKVHLKKTSGVCFCGMGAERFDIEVTELAEDATCKTCISLAALHQEQTNSQLRREGES